MELILLIGIPGAGKSTFYSHFTLHVLCIFSSGNSVNAIRGM